MHRKYFLGLLFGIMALSPAALKGQAEEEISADTKQAVVETIRSYVQQDEQLKGAFLIKDASGSTIRELEFDHVHEGVHSADQGGYLACVDFRQGAKLLDLDFTVRRGPSGHWEVSEIVIHKIDGKTVGQ